MLTYQKDDSSAFSPSCALLVFSPSSFYLYPLGIAYGSLPTGHARARRAIWVPLADYTESCMLVLCIVLRRSWLRVCWTGKRGLGFGGEGGRRKNKKKVTRSGAGGSLVGLVGLVGFGGLLVLLVAPIKWLSGGLTRPRNFLPSMVRLLPPPAKPSTTWRPAEKACLPVAHSGRQVRMCKKCPPTSTPLTHTPLSTPRPLAGFTLSGHAFHEICSLF